MPAPPPCTASPLSSSPSLSVRDCCPAEYLRGWRVKTSPVPIKPAFFTGVKSNNYLPNVLNLMDAQADGFDQVGVARCGWVGGGLAGGWVGAARVGCGAGALWSFWNSRGRWPTALS